ncbi:epsin-2 isoform X8 [Tursiops truncatus]|uniref:Epsin-2 isoform X8 n=1 Tax=Tursiops truncatus TaxID=9739 RepID=A0A6J3QJR7_TURTR|nr:epsin-2 isoform X8 [Tursiops truncatus]
MTTSSIRRQMKNIVNNYSEAEIKVREATSNDPWGPSSSLMTEIADLTYNVVAFSEIMSMVWKRLNDHGKNWRHVYKALTLLDYLIKTGSERVAQQCRENIFAIQTLKDFQYVDRDGKDQGVNVREKAKQLVALLKDEERLKAERAQALKTKERMAQVATGMGSSQLTFGRGSSQPNLSTSYSEQEYGKAGGSPASYHGSTSPRVSSELEQARPQTSGEEELQLQLALAMSREVAEQDVRPAIDGRCRTLMGKMGQTDGPARCSSLLLSYGEDAEERLRRGDDLRLQMALEESRRDTVKFPKKKEHGSHPQQTTLLDLLDALPGAGPAAPKAEPWGPSASASHTNPWGAPAAPGSTSDPWPSFGAFDLFSNLNGTIKDDFSEFDNLRASKKAGAAAASAPVNPFQVNQPQPLTLNQLRGSPVLGSSTSFGPGPAVEPVAVASVTSAASHPALGAGGSSLPPLGPAAVNMVGSLGVPPSAAQATGTTNPFLL